jgi:hypothetical protein
MPEFAKPGALATMNALEQLQGEPELEWSYLSPSAELTPTARESSASETTTSSWYMRPAEQDFGSGLRRRDDR